MARLRYDYSFMMNNVVGSHGISTQEIESYTHSLIELRQSLFVSPENELGFMQLPFNQNAIRTCLELAESIRSSFSTLIVIGIGGSDLGTRAVTAALPSQDMRIVFLGGNTDPYEIESIIRTINWHETAVNIISKSGDTIEPMSVFLYIRDLLISAVGYDAHRNHIIATTDAQSGTLRAIVDREQYRSLTIPSSVGGRFSVLSTVGLFPLACAGVAIDELCAGAADIITSLRSSSVGFLHSTELFALTHYLGYTQRNQHIHVFIPYSSRLHQISFWFRQLWAESLGKRENSRGEHIYVGPTPIASLGATDQHSQFQLYYFGPFDKIITFIDVIDHNSSIQVPRAFEDIEGVAYMHDLSFTDILRTELKASSLALAERQRPNGRLILDSINAFSIGQLLQFLEIATVYAGSLFEINSFDQPGVELGKQNMYALFNRIGFQERRSELEKLLSLSETHVV